ncbi:MAG: glycosyltransferase [Paracoccus sp. (in: a-proteobacteria)]|uniref:glycosyltransferase n=1 Tax=Paracoccus sp. TaxID=267 RepID=UPI0039E3560F
MNIVGICRFSLLGRGDWKAYQGKSEAELEAVYREKAAELFAPDRMEARLATFEHLTLASLRAQSDQDFRFVVLASEQMPATYRARLDAICAAVPQVRVFYFGTTAVDEAQCVAFDRIRASFADTLQFRLDDDDCLCAEFVALLRQHASPLMTGDEPFSVSVAGVLYSVLNGQQKGIYRWPVSFMSAGTAVRHPTKSVYSFGHFALGRRFRSVIITGHQALVTNNGNNDTSISPEIMRKRGMVRMRDDEVRPEILRDFAFLTPAGMKAAGLPAPRKDETPAPRPGWLTEISDGSHRGFYRSDAAFALQHVMRDKRILYVTFDNLAEVRSRDRLRAPWGYDFARKQDWSQLGVQSFRENWFRDRGLFEELNRLAKQGFFNQFGKVVFSGTSMGAFAACTFSSLAPGSTVIAFSPQSSLAPDLVPWDTRYPQGQRWNWHGLFRDAAEGLAKARDAWIFYDPLLEMDRRHAERLRGGNVTLLKTRYSGHFSAQMLRQVDALSRVVLDCVDGGMTEAKFYSLYRPARQLRRYQEALAMETARSGTPHSRRRVVAALRAIGRPQLAALVTSTARPD